MIVPKDTNADTIAPQLPAGTGNVTTISLDTTLEFTGSDVIRRAALTGDVTATAGSNATTIANNAVTTAKIANDAVTLAKLQNAVANNIVLGNVAGAGQPYVELTVAQLQTLLSFVDGTGTAGQLAYWTDSNTLSGDASATISAANDRVTITGTLAAEGANNAWLNLNGGSLTGTAEALRASANLSTALKAIVANARNLGNTGHAVFELEVGGTSAGDPFVIFSVPGGTDHIIGIDNSDGDKLKITPGGTAPGSTGNKGMVFTTDAATKVGINIDAPVQELDVVGRVKAHTGFVGKFAQWASGNIAFGAGAGTAPTLNSVSGTDNALYVSFTTGTSPTNNGIIFTGTYPNAWPSNSYVTFSADGTNNSATNITMFRTGGRTAAKFDFIANGTLAASTNYQFCFTIFGS